MRYANPELKQLLQGYIEQICARIYNTARELMNQETEESYKGAAKLLEGITSYQDAAQLITYCMDRAKYVHDDVIYNEAMSKIDIPKKKSLEYHIQAYKAAALIFSSVEDHRDAADKAKMCTKTVTSLTRKQKRKELHNAGLTMLFFALGIAALFVILYFVAQYLGAF